MPDPDRPRRARKRSGDDERSGARERALTLLYEAETKGASLADVLSGLPIRPDERVLTLVRGVEAHRSEADAAIREHARNWSLERMPLLDVAIMRLAFYELIAEPDTPTAVVIDEAVELAKRFSTDDSGRFVNGVLAAIAADLRRGSAPSGEPSE